MSQTEQSGTLTIEEAGKVLGISRWLAYEQARSGNLGGVPVLKIGRRLVVPRLALERVLSGEMLTAGQEPEVTGGNR